MPWGDGTGPSGMGPMTGRGAGYCAGYSAPGFWNPTPGRGFWGWGRGRRRGQWFGRWFGARGFGGWQPAAWGWAPLSGPDPYRMPYGVPFAPTLAKGQELDALKSQAKYFEEALNEIRGRIGDLEKAETEK